MQFIRFVGIVPIGVGITLLCGLWFGGSPFDGAPFFFKVMGSFVALMFLLVGSGFLFAKISPESQMKAMVDQLQRLQQENSSAANTETKVAQGGYQCSACGATLESNAEVSPHGDVKCEHCGRWFNIHKS